MHDIVHRDDDDDEEFTAADINALEQCLQAAREGDERQFFADILKDRDWFDVALSACYHVQIRSLKLYPWQAPPCVGRGAAAEALADKLIRTNLSIFEPDPAAALAAKRG